MKSYVIQLVATLLVCQMATVLSPRGSRRYLQAICGLVTILTLVTPLRTVLAQTDSIKESVKNFFSTAQEQAPEEDSLEAAAYTILTHAADRYGFDTDGAEITFFRDDEGTVTEIMLFFDGGNTYNRDRLQAELEEKLGVTVHIFLERGETGG